MPSPATEHPAAAHLRRVWFQPTETFLHTLVQAFRRSRPLLLGYERAHAQAFPVDCPVLPLYPRGSWRARWNTRRPGWLGDDPLARWDTRAARRALERHGAQLLHAHFGFTGHHALALKRATGLPLVTTFYGADASQRARVDGWRERYAELFAEGECFLTEGPHLARRLVELGCPAEKLAVHPIVLDTGRYRFRERAPRPGGETLRVLFCASFREKKGLPDALRAFAQAREKHPELSLRIGGDGPGHTEAHALVDALGIGDRVKFLGFLPHERFLAELDAADIFLQPSRTAADGDDEGGAPTTLLEAQACGLPVLATRHADIPHVVSEGESALLAEEGDVDGLSERLRLLLTEPERWAAMGLAGRERIERFHDAEFWTARLEDRYRDLVEGRPTPPADPAPRAAREATSG